MRKFALLTTCAAVLAGCVTVSDPPATPTATAANLDTSGLSIAARRFEQFCLGALGRPEDGVDLATAFYGKTPLPPLGRLKIVASTDEDISVQVPAGTANCRVTTSNGRTPNGPAEAVAVARALAARNGGTLTTSNRAGRATVNIGGRNHGITYGVSGRASGVYFDLVVGR